MVVIGMALAKRWLTSFLENLVLLWNYNFHNPGYAVFPSGPTSMR